MQVQFETHTDGKGQWSAEDRLVIINKIDIGYSSLEYFPEDPFYGELRAHFNSDGFTNGSWNVAGYGLIYTDKLWLKEFKKCLRELGLGIKAVQSVKYSEQGMQSDAYVSLDIGQVFYASWKNLQKKLSKIV
jgi:hypothetical protein